MNLHYIKKLSYKCKSFWTCSSWEEYLKAFPNTFPCKTLIPYCGITLPPGAKILTNFNLPYVRKLPFEFAFFWAYWFLRIQFSKISHIFMYLYENVWFAIVVPPYPQGPWFQQTWMRTLSVILYANLHLPVPVVLVKMFLKNALYTPIQNSASLLWLLNSPVGQNFYKLGFSLYQKAIPIHCYVKF